jgi:hypothetical protein
MVAVTLKEDLIASMNVGIITHSDFVGDREVAWRIKIAGEKLGWNVFLDENEGFHLNYHDLDCVICMLPFKKKPTNLCPCYLVVFHPFNYLNDRREFNSECENYDGFLLTINDRESLKRGLNKIGKKFHNISFFPTVYSTPYKQLLLNNLVFSIPVWGNRSSNIKFKYLYELLGKSNFTKFYGIKPNRKIDLKNYIGSIPFDGSSVLNILQEHGIVFVFHSNIHNKECIPSGRIFEAAAASAVIISDQNAFVKKHFGDSVFYVDTDLSAKDIFNQIESHIDTVFQNPESALKMAKKAHEIFNEKFSMESQLIKLEKMHNNIILGWKN